MADKWRLDKNTHKWVLDLSPDDTPGYKPKTSEEIKALAAKPSPSPAPKEESMADMAARLKRERDARAAKYVSKKKKEQE